LSIKLFDVNRKPWVPRRNLPHVAAGVRRQVLPDREVRRLPSPPRTASRRVGLPGHLGRYTHRVAISNARLRALQDDQVSFEWKDYSDGNHSDCRDLLAELTRIDLRLCPQCGQGILSRVSFSPLRFVWTPHDAGHCEFV